MAIHPDDYAAHIATEADANRERFAGSHAELPTWSPIDELTEEELEELQNTGHSSRVCVGAEHAKCVQVGTDRNGLPIAHTTLI